MQTVQVVYLVQNILELKCTVYITTENYTFEIEKFLLTSVYYLPANMKLALHAVPSSVQAVQRHTSDLEVKDTFFFHLTSVRAVLCF